MPSQAFAYTDLRQYRFDSYSSKSDFAMRGPPGIEFDEIADLKVISDHRVEILNSDFESVMKNIAVSIEKEKNKFNSKVHEREVRGLNPGTLVSESTLNLNQIPNSNEPNKIPNYTS